MTAGFQVITDAGSILIDQDFPNLALVARGTIAIGSNADAGGYRGTVNIPATGMPMVFVRSGGFVAIVDATVGSFGYLMAQGVTSFDYFAFAPPQSLPSNYGMQVFDGAGRLCFDAAQQYLRVTGVIAINAQVMNFNDSGGVGNILSFGLPGATPAICFSDPGFQFQVLTGSGVSGGTSYRTIARCGMRINGAALDIAQVQARSDISLPGGVNVNTRSAASPMSAIIADVTGM